MCARFRIASIPKFDASRLEKIRIFYRLCTGVQHGSVLAIAIGIFILLFAFNTKPSPEGFLTVGIATTTTGICGSIVGWAGKRFFSRRGQQGKGEPT